MLTIRLFRVGKKKQPFYKIIVTESKNAPSRGRFVDEIGFYNPITKEKRIDKDKVIHWIGKGAQKSDTVNNLLVKEGIIQGDKIPKHKASKKKQGEHPEEKQEQKQADQSQKEEPKKEEQLEEEKKNEETSAEEEKEKVDQGK